MNLASTGNVAAKRLLCQKIAGCFVCSCPAAAANAFEFAGTALAFKFIVIAQGVKNIRVLPYLGKGALSDIATVCGQKSTGLDISPVRDEAETNAA